MCSSTGVVAVGEDKNEGWWFSDGYGDYTRQFLAGLGAVPDWAPADEDHLLRSTSVVRGIEYEPGRVHYDTFDANATDVLKLQGEPVRVLSGDAALERRDTLDEPGYTLSFAPGGGFVVRLRHDAASVEIVTAQALIP
jgi:hypothetical protein